MPISARWITAALLNLGIAACLGALLRFIFLHEVPGVEYRNVLHAHSHGAVLGWVFLALYAGYVYLVQPAADGTGACSGPPSWWCWACSRLSAGRATALSTLHILLAYAAVALLWPDLRRRLAGQAALPWQLAGLAIQFFLHFQLNGWFAFGGLVLSYLEQQQQQPVRHAGLPWLLGCCPLSCSLIG